jgi:hypothetical protein
MKKFTAVLLASLLLGVLLIGCGRNEQPTNPDNNDVQTESNTGDSSDTAAPAQRLSQPYVDIMTSGTFFMKYRVNQEVSGTIIDASGEMAVDGENLAMVTEVMGMQITIIIKDGTSYMLDHTNKTALSMGSGALPTQQENEMPHEFTYKGSGTGDLKGTTYPYEEYTTESGSIKFFFDGTRLAGFEIVFGDHTIQYEVSEFSGTVPEGMFEIPADYTVTEMNQ